MVAHDFDINNAINSNGKISVAFFNNSKLYYNFTNTNYHNTHIIRLNKAGDLYFLANKFNLILVKILNKSYDIVQDFDTYRAVFSKQ